ncbi:hypothetical protein PoB_004233000 [Plakobranchus ocellatus]|uniref:Secreted protein n=1 Tax=Plakobranchus ocellatus TaxID=259542 RepID=A0AAV4B9Q0_9GAST|nr:hypothetical protein PoB_004233000 [Plakobranchus ocellatus]
MQKPFLFLAALVSPSHFFDIYPFAPISTSPQRYKTDKLEIAKVVSAADGMRVNGDITRNSQSSSTRSKGDCEKWGYHKKQLKQQQKE